MGYEGDALRVHEVELHLVWSQETLLEDMLCRLLPE